MQAQFYYLVLLCIQTVSTASMKQFPIQFPQEWHSWKLKHSKNYTSLHEELERHITWLSNQAYIDAYNNREEVFGFTLGMNEFGDLTDLEFQEKYRCIVPPNSYSYSIENNSNFKKHMKLYERPQNLSIPESVDWRSMGAISSVKSQGKCCSCYAFGALGSLEGVHALATGKLTELSAQNILDCSGAYGNRGCRKGSVENTYLYIIDNNGIDTRKSYPYVGKQSTCHFKKSTIGATMQYFVRIEEGEEKDLETAVASQGPIAVMVDASHNIFRFYKSGVLNIPNCSRNKVTQALVLVGYGTYSGKKYWLVKNSWGTSWGMKGFGMMSRGKYNQCGIATHATFPSL